MQIKLLCCMIFYFAAVNLLKSMRLQGYVDELWVRRRHVLYEYNQHD